MDKEEKIKKIIDVLDKYEGRLSDGYKYYSDDSVEETLKDIAEDILLSLKQ